MAAGQEGLGGFRMIALASAVLWAAAAFVLPVATDLEPGMTITVGLSMSALGALVALLSRWAPTLDRQHALATLLTSVNGIVILALALAGGALPGYGVAAMMMLFAWGVVARTRFIYASIRTAVVGAAFIVAVALYPGEDDLTLDVFLFAAACRGLVARAAHPGAQPPTPVRPGRRHPGAERSARPRDGQVRTAHPEHAAADRSRPGCGTVS